MRCENICNVDNDRETEMFSKQRNMENYALHTSGFSNENSSQHFIWNCLSNLNSLGIFKKQIMLRSFKTIPKDSSFTIIHSDAFEIV